MDLYSPTILELNSDAPNFGKNEDAGHHVKAYNTFCGDKFTIAFDVNGTIRDILFHGYGCAVSKSSAALLTEVLTGKTPQEAISASEEVIAFLKEEQKSIDHIDPRLEAFAVVGKYPGRYDCAALSWTEMAKYLKSITEPTS